MQTDQIFNKPVLVNFTYDYVGTIYKLIASGNSGEMQFALVESKPSGKMFILPLDKIVNITEDYIVIDSRQALADFELFQEMAKGEYLILDETTANRADISKIMEGRAPSAKTGMSGTVSYLSFMQPEPQPEPPTLEELEARREAEIQASLRELDLQLIRPMAAIVAGTATADDETMFAELIGQKTSLRNELHNVKLKDS